MSLQITNLCKRFGETQALDGITFGVEPGQVFGFLGANGAGKTTTMRIVLDILRADSGTVTWQGRPSTDLPRRTFGYLPEEPGLCPRMQGPAQHVLLAGPPGAPRKPARANARGGEGLQGKVGERVGVGACLANVVAWPRAAVRLLEAEPAFAEIHLSRDPRVDHPLQRAIDGRPADAMVVAANQIDEVVGAEMPFLAQEHVDDLFPLA